MISRNQTSIVRETTDAALNSLMGRSATKVMHHAAGAERLRPLCAAIEGMNATRGAGRDDTVAALLALTSSPVGLDPICACIYQLALRHAYARPNVASVAGLLSCSPRHLERHFRCRNLPPPQRLIVLARWIPVSTALCSHRARPDQISSSLGFASSQAFYRSAVREVRMSVPELRQPEAVIRLAAEIVTAYQAVSAE